MTNIEKKTKVIKAYFCVYDFFSNKDVRIEANYPGSSSAYALSDVDKQYPVDWINTYLSSKLRSFRM